MERVIKIILICLAVVCASITIYSIIEIYRTEQQIKVTCHKALAFDNPTLKTVAICHAHGIYK